MHAVPLDDSHFLVERSGGYLFLTTVSSKALLAACLLQS